MAFTQNPVATRVKQPQLGLIQIANGDASSQKTLMTAGANGSKVTGIIFSSTDSTARNIQVSVSNGSTNFILGTVVVPITAGTDGVTPAVSFFNSALVPGYPVDNDGQSYFFVPGANTVQISSTTTVTTAKFITASCIYGDF